MRKQHVNKHQDDVKIPARDHWIYKNPEVLESLMKGIEDAKKNRIRKLDIDFSEFL